MEPSPLRRSSGHDAYADILPSLTMDNAYEILLRLPAKDLCRLRAVSRSWWSFLSKPQFMADHAARHREPLIVAGYNTYHPDGRILYDICDLSGRTVKRVHARAEEWVLYGQPDLLCVVDWANKSLKLLNPGTGVAHVLPIQFAEGHAAYHRLIHKHSFTATFGQVASTGVYKVIRFIFVLDGGRYERLYEIFTLDGNIHGRWRAKQAPPYQIEMDHWGHVVINGIVYFFLTYNVDEDKRRIGSFNLETEEWSPSIPGPLSSFVDNAAPDDIDYMFQLSIGALSGSLVIACHPASIIHSSLDLWFLVDFQRGLWVKQYSIELGFIHPAYAIHPFSVLNDGRIVFVIDTVNSGGLLSIYNPETKTYEDVMEMGYAVVAGLYTGSALSVTNKVPVISENTTGFADGP